MPPPGSEGDGTLEEADEEEEEAREGGGVGSGRVWESPSRRPD